MLNVPATRLPGLSQSQQSFWPLVNGAGSQPLAQQRPPPNQTSGASMDREDGELSDTVKPPSVPRISQTLAHGTQNVRTSQISLPVGHGDYNERGGPTRQQKEMVPPNSAGASPALPPAAAQEGITEDYLAQQKAIAKSFVSAWDRSGRTYDQLVAEGLDAQILTGIFQELGLHSTLKAASSQPALVEHQPHRQLNPAIPAKRLAPGSVDVLENTLPAAQSHTHPKAATTSLHSNAHVPNGNLALPKKPPPLASRAEGKRDESPASAGLVPFNKEQAPAPDRQEYIAKLMAAKNKKSEPPKPNAQLPTLRAHPVGVEPAQSHSAASTMLDVSKNVNVPGMNSPNAIASVIQHDSIQGKSAVANDLAEAKRRAQTAFVKRRMEELAQKKAAKAAEAAAGEPSAGLPTQPILVEDRKPDEAHPSNVDIETKRPTDTMSPPSGTDAVHDDPIAVTTASIGTRAPSVTSRIPGLFMTAPPQIRGAESERVSSPMGQNLPFPSKTQDSIEAVVPTRKRPVAADFMDNETWRSPKRPFGYNQKGGAEESIVIEVSDDETANSGQSPEVAARAKPQHKDGSTTKINVQVPQTAGEKKDDLNLPRSSLHNASPAPNSDTIRHQMNILAMKKKIAELELKRRQTKINSARPATPSKPTIAAPVLSTTPHLGDQISEIQKKITKEDLHSPDEQQTSTPAQSLRTVAPEHLSTQETPSTVAQASTAYGSPAPGSATPDVTESADWRSRRRTAIKSGLPALEAKSANDNSKLAALRAQMEELEEAIRKDQGDKQRLIDELESLGVDTEGMDHNELRETKDEMVAQAVADASKPNIEHGPDSSALSRSETIALSRSPTTHRSPGDGPHVSSAQSTAASMSISSAEGSVSEAASPSLAPSESDDVMRNVIESDESEEMSGGFESPADKASESREQSEIREPTHRSMSQLSDDESDAVDEQEASVQAHSLPRESPSEDASMNDASGAESGEIDSIDSIDSIATPDISEQATDLKSVTSEAVAMPFEIDREATDLAGDNGSDAESDFYEPPEPDESHIGAGSAQASTSASPSEIAEEDYEPPDAPMSHQSEEGEVFEDEEEYAPPEFQAPTSAPTLPLARVAASRLDGGITERAALEDSDPARVGDSESKINAFEDLPSSETFKPYQSALRSFRAYRFHPKFAETIPGGWRSATYSFLGDPARTWCPSEADGGNCNDESCDHQHFRSMTVQDDELLRQLGISNPGGTEEEKAEFTAGLRSVIIALRQSDPTADALANAIISYRRKYMGEHDKDTIFGF